MHLEVLVDRLQDHHYANRIQENYLEDVPKSAIVQGPRVCIVEGWMARMARMALIEFTIPVLRFQSKENCKNLD